MKAVTLIKDGQVIEPDLWEKMLEQIQRETKVSNYTLKGFGVEEMKIYSALINPAEEFVAACGVLHRSIFSPNHFRFLNRLYTFQKFRGQGRPPLWCIKHLLPGHIASFDGDIVGFISRENLHQPRVLNHLKEALNTFTGRQWTIAPGIYRVGPGKGGANFQQIIYFSSNGHPLDLALKPTTPTAID